MHRLIVGIDQERQDVDKSFCAFARQIPVDLVAQLSVETLDHRRLDGFVLGAKVFDASFL